VEVIEHLDTTRLALSSAFSLNLRDRKPLL
jgi:hypothetical protein